MDSVPLQFPPVPPDELARRARAFQQALSSRRTVRAFFARAVPRDVIATCVATAAGAPSGANLQPWHFAVVGEPALKRRIRLAAEKEEAEFYAERAPAAWLAALAPLGTDASKPFLETAPWLIAVFTQQSYLDDRGSSHPTYYAKESTGIACGFLLAALHHAGLATLTHTPSPMNFLGSILGRPLTEKPFLLVVTGYPAPEATVPAAALRKKPLDQIVSFQ